MKQHAKDPFPGVLVQRASPRFGLLRHDKLHLGGSLSKFVDFAQLLIFPAVIFFFRATTSRLTGVCPLFSFSGLWDGVIGLSLDSIEFDVLHTIDLGVTQRVIGAILMMILSSPLDFLGTGLRFSLHPG